MHDTDRIARPHVSFADLTPTTAPTWSPLPVPTLPPLPVPGRAGGKRMARGTVPPLPSLRPRPPTVVLRQELPDAPALPVRLVVARGWGQVERVGLDGELRRRPAASARAATAAADPMPVLAALGIAIAALLAVLATTRSVDDTARATLPDRAPAPLRPAPVQSAAALPPPVITPLAEPIVESPIEPGAATERTARAPTAARTPVTARAPITPAVARTARPTAREAGQPSRAMADLDGELAIGAKPPCRIIIDGRDTGLLTPQRKLRLPEGRHEITLINAEFGIEDRSTVHIGAGSSTRLVRDLSAHLDR